MNTPLRSAIRGKIGMRARDTIVRPDAKTISDLARYGTDLVADGMNRFGAIRGGIHSLNPGWRMAGPACTVRARPGDNLIIQYALSVAQPGDVLVVSTCGHADNAVWGELMNLAALKLGLAGVVTDGGARDLPLLRDAGFPVFAAGITPTACDKDGPGEVNFPVALGHVPVLPGDIVIGDDDGVVVVSPADVADILEGIKAKLESETRRRAEIASGKVVPDAVIAAVEKRFI